MLKPAINANEAVRGTKNSPGCCKSEKHSQKERFYPGHSQEEPNLIGGEMEANHRKLGVGDKLDETIALDLRALWGRKRSTNGHGGNGKREIKNKKRRTSKTASYYKTRNKILKEYRERGTR